MEAGYIIGCFISLHGPIPGLRSNTEVNYWRDINRAFLYLCRGGKCGSKEHVTGGEKESSGFAFRADRRGGIPACVL